MRAIRDRVGVAIDPQVATPQLPRDQPPRPTDPAAQVEHGGAVGDAGLPGQRPDLAGAHEALLVDVLARGVRRLLRSPEGLEVGRGRVLAHISTACGRTARARGAAVNDPKRDVHGTSLHMAEYDGTLRTVHVGLAVVPIVQLLMLMALAATVGLGGAGWVVGLACAVVLYTLLARSLARGGSEGLGPADWVTVARAALVVDVAALTADSFASHTSVAALVSLATAALCLDFVDGRVARNTQTESRFGAALDGEVDAFLILTLSLYVAPAVGWWVLAIGAARYAFLAAGWPFAWMRAPLPRRDWRKVVTAVVGIALVIAAADVLPLAPDAPRAGGGAGPAGRVVRPRRVLALAPPARVRRRGGDARAAEPRSRSAAGPAGRRPAPTPPGRHRGRAHHPRAADRVGRPARPDPAATCPRRRVREAPDRGPGARRAGPRPARQVSAVHTRSSPARCWVCWCW